MATTMEQRIALAQQRLNQLKAQQAQKQRREKAEATRRQRQVDVRRKILAGAVLLDAVAKCSFPQQQFMDMMDATLTRNDDREIFGLKPLTDSANSKTGSEAQP
jgi:hypothetical protein